MRPDTLRNAKSVKELKVGDSERRRETDNHRESLTSRKGKSIMGYRISKAFNQQNMENRKANLTTSANRGNLTSHQMTVCKKNMTNTKTG